MPNMLDALKKRLEWVAEAPHEPIYPDGPTREQYVRGFDRKSGSYVEPWLSTEEQPMATLIEFLRDFDDVAQVHPGAPFEAPGHTYYQCSLGKWRGFQNVKALRALTDEELEQVRVVRGAHGLELCITVGGIASIPTDIVSFICDDDGLVTWYPGDFTARVDIVNATVKFAT